MTDSDLRLLPLSIIAQRCAQETERFFQRLNHDSRYCFELFRQSFVECNERAWEYIYAQYHSLVAKWVSNHTSFPGSGENIPYFVNRAFEKMWIAVSPKFGDFEDLGSLLGYLKMCVGSVIIDHTRKFERLVVDDWSELPKSTSDDDNTSAEKQALENVHRQELWEATRTRLRNEKERRVMYGSFHLGLKPQGVHELYPKTFRDVREVYRVKENVLARLRRDKEFLELLGGDAEKIACGVVYYARGKDE